MLAWIPHQHPTIQSHVNWKVCLNEMQETNFPRNRNITK